VQLTVSVHARALVFSRSLSYGVWPPRAPCGRWKLYRHENHLLRFHPTRLTRGLASANRDRGFSGRTRLGRPANFYGPRARDCMWPPLRPTRLCHEHASVGVVCPPASQHGPERRKGAVHRTRRPSRLLRGGDLRRGQRPLSTAGRDRTRGARAVRPEPWLRRRGRLGVHGQRPRHRSHHRTPCRARRDRPRQGRAGDRLGEGQERPHRRPHPGDAPCLGVPARCVDAR
jgi:hypothetical protein